MTLGGDGTVLHLASLFEEDLPLPPVMSFAMGTLGFLTPFDVTHFEHHFNRVLQDFDTDVECTLRSRKRCEVITASGKTGTVGTSKLLLQPPFLRLCTRRIMCLTNVSSIEVLRRGKVGWMPFAETEMEWCRV